MNKKNNSETSTQPNLQAYLDRVQERRKEREPIALAMPSGVDWLVLPVSVPQMAVGGRLPTGLFKQQKNGQELSQEAQIEAGIQAMELTRDVMLNNLVFPKITATDEPDAIPLEKVGELIDPEDFEFFMQWLLAGGQAAQNSFRKPNSK